MQSNRGTITSENLDDSGEFAQECFPSDRYIELDHQVDRVPSATDDVSVYLSSNQTDVVRFSSDFLSRTNLLKATPQDDIDPESLLELGATEVIIETTIDTIPSIDFLSAFQKRGINVKILCTDFPNLKNSKSENIEIVSILSRAGIGILWTTSAYLKYQIAYYATVHDLRFSIASVAEHAGIEAPTLYNHTRKNQAFMSRTWLRFRTALGITSEEESSLVDLQLLGLSIEKVAELKADIRAVIATMLNTKPDSLEIEARGKELIGSHVLELFMITHPEYSETHDSRLSTLVYETLEELSIEDPRKSVVEDIVNVSRALKELHDPSILEAIRNTKIGDMTEQYAELALQLQECCTVNEYVLTTVRDGLGNVRKATDIIDYVAFYPSSREVLQKAYFENEIANNTGRYSTHDQGVFSIETLDGQKALVYRNDKGEVVRQTSSDVSKNYWEEMEGRWVSYRDNTSDSIVTLRSLPGSPRYEFFHETTIAEIKNKESAFDTNSWTIGIEVKKAGAQNVTHIISQLKRQRDAIYKLRREDPFSLGASIAGITVIVLHSNQRLKEAIEELNKEEQFFAYSEMRDIDGQFTKDISERLEDSTLKEAVIFERFLRRMNQELALEPTLKTVSSMYSLFPARFADTNSTDRDAQEEDIHLPWTEEEGEAESDKKQIVLNEKRRITRELFQDFKHLIRSTQQEIDEEQLRALFAKWFPDADYDMPSRYTKVTVHQDVVHQSTGDRELVTFTRPINMFLHKASIDEMQVSRFEVLLQRVQQIASEHFECSSDFDLNDPERLERFLDTLRNDLKLRLLAKQKEDTIENEFLTGFFRARLSDASERMKESSLCTLSHHHMVRRSSLIARARALVLGVDFQTVEAMQEQSVILLAMFQYALRAQELDDTDDSKKDALPNLCRMYLSSGKGRRNAAQNHEAHNKFRSQFEPILAEMIEFCRGRLRTSTPITLELIDNWTERLHRIANQHEEICRNLALASDVSPMIDSSPLPAPIDITIKQELDAFLPDDTRFLDMAEESEQSTSSLEELYPLSRNDEDSHASNTTSLKSWISLLSVMDLESMHNLEDEEIEAMKLKASSFMDEITSGESRLAMLLRENAEQLRAAVSTEAYMSEDKALWRYCVSLLNNTSLLAMLDADMASDYMSSSIRCIFEFPSVYSDVYFQRLCEIQKFLQNGDNAAAILNYLSWLNTRDDRTHTTSGGQILKQLVLVSIQTSPFSSGKDVSCTSEVLDRFFVYIKAHRYEDGCRLLQEYSSVSVHVLNRFFREQAKDPHLAWERSSYEKRTSIARRICWKGEQIKSAYDFEQEVDRFLNANISSVIQRDESGRISHFKNVPPRQEELFKNALRRVLRASARVYRRYPDLFKGSAANMWSSRRYQGFPEYNTMRDNLDIVLSLEPMAFIVHTIDPTALHEYCNYRRGPGFTDEDTARLRKPRRKVRRVAKKRKKHS